LHSNVRTRLLHARTCPGPMNAANISAYHLLAPLHQRINESTSRDTTPVESAGFTIDSEATRNSNYDDHRKVRLPVLHWFQSPDFHCGRRVSVTSCLVTSPDFLKAFLDSLRQEEYLLFKQRGAIGLCSRSPSSEKTRTRGPHSRVDTLA